MDYGTEVFCAHKKINAIKTVKSYTKETGLQVQDNFSKFASWVDRKIKSGELKGDDTPVHGSMWKNHKEEQRLYKERMASFSDSQHDFWRKCKKVSLARFLSLNGLHLIKQDSEAKTKLGRMIPLYNLLVENELLEDFLNYTEDESKT